VNPTAGGGDGHHHGHDSIVHGIHSGRCRLSAGTVGVLCAPGVDIAVETSEAAR
jgi:hypothetical protein